MSYKNKTYVIFDGDTDMHYYRLMTAWKAHDHIEFDFHNAHDLNSARDTSTEESIKAQLRLRMANSKQVVVLVGDNTFKLRKFVPWEIELARKKDLPIIVVNLNGKRTHDISLCPSAVEDETYTVHIPFGQKIMKYALNEFPDDYNGTRDRATKGHRFHYKDHIYTQLGI